MAAEPPERRGGPRGQVADVAAAEDRDRSPEPVGEIGQRRRRRRRQAHGVGVGDDFGKRAVEVEEERVGGAEPQALEAAQGHAGTTAASSAARKLRRHQPMSCSRTERIMSCQRSTRSSSGMVSAR